MATDLAKLVVKLEAQTGKFQKDLDKANKKLTNFSKKTKREVGNITKILGGLAFAGFGAAIIKATTEAEAAFKQLEQGILSTNKVVGFSAKELAGYATELQNATTFDDDSIIRAQSQLVTFTKITGDEFLRTTEIALDMSERFGTDVKSSILQLGKALNDPIANLSALSRAGIQFSKEQKDLIKTLIDSGDQVSAQKIILKELEVQFGGSARAARDTFGGALKGLSNAFSDLIESDTGLNAAKDSIESLSKQLADPKTKKAAAELTSSLISGFSTLVSILAEIPEFAKFLGEEIAAAIHGPNDLIRIADALIEKNEELKEQELTLAKYIGLSNNAMFMKASNGEVLTKNQQDLVDGIKEEIAQLELREQILTPRKMPTFNLNNNAPGETKPDPAVLGALASGDLGFGQNEEKFAAELEKSIEHALKLEAQEIAAFESKIARLEESFLTEFGLLEFQRDERLRLLDEEIASKVLSEEEVSKLKLKITDKFNKDKKKLDEVAAKAELQTTLTVAHGVLGILSAFAQKSFKAQKALAIAEGIINIIGGVTKALNNKYPANLAFAAQVAAQGAGLLSTIKSTQLSSTSASLNASSGAAASGFSTPVAATSVQSAEELNSQNNLDNQIQTIQNTYYIEANGNDAEKIAEDLIEMIDSGKVIINPGSRQAEELVPG